jgi:hypothetical protein
MERARAPADEVANRAARGPQRVFARVRPKLTPREKNPTTLCECSRTVWHMPSENRVRAIGGQEAVGHRSTCCADQGLILGTGDATNEASAARTKGGYESAQEEGGKEGPEEGGKEGRKEEEVANLEAGCCPPSNSDTERGKRCLARSTSAPSLERSLASPLLMLTAWEDPSRRTGQLLRGRRTRRSADVARSPLRLIPHGR